MCSASRRSERATEIVLDETCTQPRSSPLRRPSGPKTTDSTAASSASMVNTTSAPRAASAGLEATRAPRCRMRSVRAKVRLKTASVCPAASRLSAMGSPMDPRPMNPRFMIDSASPGDAGSPNGALHDGKPGNLRASVGRRLRPAATTQPQERNDRTRNRSHPPGARSSRRYGAARPSLVRISPILSSGRVILLR